LVDQHVRKFFRSINRLCSQSAQTRPKTENVFLLGPKRRFALKLFCTHSFL
jgi:hypothetical protein